jgi:hypothetical protein
MELCQSVSFTEKNFFIREPFATLKISSLHPFIHLISRLLRSIVSFFFHDDILCGKVVEIGRGSASKTLLNIRGVSSEIFRA